ncbi:MAG: amino acid permease [Micrococcaceae bacterium]
MAELLNEHPDVNRYSAEEQGYEKGLGRRQIQMIAIGGAIGTGLLLGAGGRLKEAGPSLAVVYLVCGLFGFLILRALGEMVVYRPASGAFVSYAREFIGEHAAFVAGWLYFIFWALTGIADSTAVATYFRFWGIANDQNQWFIALISLLIVTAVNLIGVKLFGELEFWFAVIKVTALVAFLLIGTWIVGTRQQIDGHSTGISLITNHGGLFPNGVLPAVILTQGVIFAYAGIELVGIAAGETDNPQAIVPSAINSVIWRILLFYVGSVVILAMLLPWNAYSADTSPFVTFFQKLGIPGMGNVMNVVVITAAMSSLNSGIYATARTLRSMGMAGSAPHFTSKMNKNHVPVNGIMLTVCVSMVGVILNYIFPSQAFEIVLNFASLGTIGVWTLIMITHLCFRKSIADGITPAPKSNFALMFSPWSNYITIAFLFLVLVLTYFDKPVGQWTILSIPLIVVLFYLGWRIAEPNIAKVQQQWDQQLNIPHTNVNSAPVEND